MCVEVGEGGETAVRVSVCSPIFKKHGVGDSFFMKPASGRAVRSERRETCA